MATSTTRTETVNTIAIKAGISAVIVFMAPNPSKRKIVPVIASAITIEAMNGAIMTKITATEIRETEASETATIVERPAFGHHSKSER